MRVGRTHRVQLRLPIRLEVPGRPHAYTGETLDISQGGFSLRIRTDDRLPTIASVQIQLSEAAGDSVYGKGQLVWQGGLLRGMKRANYRIIFMSRDHQRRLAELIQAALDGLIADLGDLPLFSSAAVADLAHLLTLARIRETEAGTSLYESGKYDAAGTFILLDGHAVAQRNGHQAALGRGRVCGQWADGELHPHAETVRARTALRFLYLPAALQREVSVQAPRVADLLQQALEYATDVSTVKPPRKLRRTETAAFS